MIETIAVFRFLSASIHSRSARTNDFIITLFCLVFLHFIPNFKAITLQRSLKTKQNRTLIQGMINDAEFEGEWAYVVVPLIEGCL